jgi:hypothetical protein
MVTNVLSQQTQYKYTFNSVQKWLNGYVINDSVLTTDIKRLI